MATAGSGAMLDTDSGLFGRVVQWRKHGDSRDADAAAGRQGKSIEYLFDDEYKTIGPTWSARVCYGVGTTYLFGLLTGGLWGAVEGLRNRQGLTTGRLRVNAFLNALSSRGPFVGNNAAVVALLYNGIHGGIVGALGDHGQSGLAIPTAAATMSGALFGASGGWRAAGKGGAALGAAMLFYSGFTDYIKHGRIYIQ